MSSEATTTELVLLGAPLALRDGSRIRIRQGHRTDQELLVRGFERLSPESRYRRFLAPIPSSASQWFAISPTSITTTTRRSLHSTRKPAKGSASCATFATHSGQLSPKWPSL